MIDFEAMGRNSKVENLLNILNHINVW